MPEAKFASLPAADPGSPGFRSVQPRSIFQRVVKPALRATVSVVCAGSIAVQAVTVSSYAQPGHPAGPNTTRYDQSANNGFDAPLMPNSCAAPANPNNPQCPVSISEIEPAPPENNTGDQGASTYYSAGPSTSGSNSAIVPISIGALNQLGHAAATDGLSQQPETSQANQPWYSFPSINDHNDLFFSWLWSFPGFVAVSAGLMAWTTISTTTDNGNIDDLRAAHQGKVMGMAAAGLLTWLIHSMRIPIWLFTYNVLHTKYLKKVPKEKPNETPQEKERREKLEKDADESARIAGTAALVLWGTVIIAVIGGIFVRAINGELSKDQGGGHRRKLLANFFPPRGPIGNKLAEYRWYLSQIELFKQTDGRGYQVILPAYKSMNIPSMKVDFPAHLDFSGKQMSLPVHIITEDPVSKVSRLTRRPKDLVFNPATLSQLPAKIVADGLSVWMLAGRGVHGYNIYKRPQYKDPWSLREDGENWKKVSGELVDLYPGQNFVWGTNANHEIFACKQPCDNGDWKRVPGKANRVAVGPYYAVSTKTTKDMETRVWIKDGAGTIFSRWEDDTKPTTSTWLNHSRYEYYRNMVPKRVRDLLNERDTTSDWNDVTRYALPIKELKSRAQNPTTPPTPNPPICRTGCGP